MENTYFSGFSAGLRRPNHLCSSRWLNSGFDGLVPYLPDLNLLDFSISCVLQPKSQAMPHANLATLCPSIVTEYDLLAVVYIYNTCLSFHHRHKAVAKKN
jgi:hypothetical protein